MPAIPASTRSSITLRILLRAKEHWPQLENLQVTSHGSFAYATAALPGGEPQPLFRLRYGGSAHSFGFAIYSHAADRYEDAVLLTGSPAGTPQEALDTAATLYTAGIAGTEPPTNLRAQPLRSISVCSPRPNWVGRADPIIRFACGALIGRLIGPAFARVSWTFLTGRTVGR